MTTPEDKGVFLHVTFRVTPSDAEAFLEALKPCWEACVNEPECLFFDVTQDPGNPGVFRFVEAWSKGKEWFMTEQISKPYYEPYFKTTQPLLLEPRKVELFERVPGFAAVNPGYLASAYTRKE